MFFLKFEVTLCSLSLSSSFSLRLFYCFCTSAAAELIQVLLERGPIIGIFNPMSRLDKSTKILNIKSNQQRRFTCTYYCKDEGEVKFHWWSLTYLKVQIIHQDHFNTIKNYSVGNPKGWIGCFWLGKSFMINFRNFLVYHFYFYFTKMHVIERASKLIEVYNLSCLCRCLLIIVAEIRYCVIDFPSLFSWPLRVIKQDNTKILVCLVIKAYVVIIWSSLSKKEEPNQCVNAICK